MTAPGIQSFKTALLFAAEHENASVLVALLLFRGAHVDAQETQVALGVNFIDEDETHAFGCAYAGGCTSYG